MSHSSNVDIYPFIMAAAAVLMRSSVRLSFQSVSCTQKNGAKHKTTSSTVKKSRPAFKFMLLILLLFLNCSNYI